MTDELAIHLLKIGPKIISFAEVVAGSTVRFSACSWRKWLAIFPLGMTDHADRLFARFSP